MPSYKSFAVVGAGTLRLPIVNALAAQNVSVVLLSRPGASAKTVPATVKVITVDFTEAAAVAAVLKEYKVDVVLAQTSLVEAAKLAAVKLFAPSEYVMPTEGQAEGFLGAKNQIAADLKAAGIASSRFFVIGNFTEFIPWLVGYADHGKIRIVGKGEVRVSFTSIGDIAGYVAYVLTTLPASELENRIFRIEGDHASLNDLGPLFKTSVEHVDGITGDDGFLKTLLLGLVDTGAGSTGWDEATKTEGLGSQVEGSANALWPGHQWKTIKDVHSL
ncbi:NAD(P)-binding protein [Mycena rosella]|uniref:NAD(P)-binding protein n=1 Tax=Mycena rosella TaxID=1033263 RepID=A0AAD7DF07_MYCRO|nr:NAD(P)-binding protein [Mycena rosella]